MRTESTNKACLLAITFSFFLFFSYGCETYKEEKIAKQMIEKCKDVQVGMTQDEVVKIMGTPRNIVEFEKNDIKLIRIYYPSSKNASTPTQFLVNKETGLVEEVVCGEDYVRSK